VDDSGMESWHNRDQAKRKIVFDEIFPAKTLAK